MRIYYLLIAGLLCITSCHKPKPLPACCGGPTSGEVIVIFKPATEIARVFALTDSLNFTILHASLFNYVSGWPVDSMGEAITLIRSRSYLDNISSITLANVNGISMIKVTPSFRNLTQDNEKDWLSLITRMQLQDVNDTGKGGLFKVPVGQENFWINALSKNPMVKKAVRDEIGTL